MPPTDAKSRPRRPVFAVESDDERTTFDPKPWGARQRMLPTKTFVDRLRRSGQVVSRMSGPLGAKSVSSVPSLPSGQSDLPEPPLPSAAMTAALPMPTQMTMSMSALQTLAHAPAVVFAPVARQFDRALTATGWHGTAQAPAAPTTLSKVGAPIGLALSVLAMIIGSLAQPAPSTHLTGLGAFVTVQRKAPPRLTLDAPAPAMAVMTETPSVPDDELITPAETFAAAPELAPTVPAEEPTAAEPARRTKRASSAKVRRPARSPAPTGTSGKRRPRKIVAGDTSTPLGGLRPRRF